MHYSSTSVEFGTPLELVKRVERDLDIRFTLYPAASDALHVAPKYFTQETNGLARSWTDENSWLNPPYGRVIGDWMAKAASEGKHGFSQVMALVPARTDTAWWQEIVWPNARRIAFIKGRIKFDEAIEVCGCDRHGAGIDPSWCAAPTRQPKYVRRESKNAAPFPSALVYFYPDPSIWPGREDKLRVGVWDWKGEKSLREVWR